MSRGNYPLLRASGQPWSLTEPAIDHPLRELPHWVLALGRRLMTGQGLTTQEATKLAAWKEVQRQKQEDLWPDDHAIVRHLSIKV